MTTTAPSPRSSDTPDGPGKGWIVVKADRLKIPASRISTPSAPLKTRILRRRLPA